MTEKPIRYKSADEDSSRWVGFEQRPGDIVISTRSKHGTTWMQMICALLIFRRGELPRPLAELSPWLDWTGRPAQEVHEHLATQCHRRFIKTHTPLDGIPHRSGVHHVVVARHPLDAAVSLYHQGDNLDRNRMHQLTGAPQPPHNPRLELRDWLSRWVDEDVGPREAMDSLPGVLHHLTDAWSRARSSPPSAVLIHYEDLARDLRSEMARLADVLQFDILNHEWHDLVREASFQAMKANASIMAPNSSGVLKRPDRFFRRGQSGEGAAALPPWTLERYRSRCEELAPPDLLEWLHR